MLSPPRHLHLDPLGGLAGDMFAAAVLHAFPDLAQALRATLESSALADLVTLDLSAGESEGISGCRIAFRPHRPEAHQHRDFASIVTLLESARLPGGVVVRSKEIFAILAQAEGQVHGIPPERVEFHEIGAWDSIADIVSAAVLIETLDADWSCAPLPLGSGSIATAHGSLPVPAPATAYLLEGFAVRNDGVRGERVTPTGAAILRHLKPAPVPPSHGFKLGGCGHGLGSRDLPGLSNLLRMLVFEPCDPTATGEELTVCEFEIDDQSAEDLAVALERLRSKAGVRDVIQLPVFAKKGRLAARVEVLVETPHAEALFDTCFLETTTLGLRSHRVQRRALPRQIVTRSVDSQQIAVKYALRPTGCWTAKAEMDDLQARTAGREGRERLRRLAEAMPSPAEGGHDEC